MKTQRNILIAFVLNLAFSIFELVGGVLTGSVAILSDALHDIADAASIGVSYFLERKSQGKPDSRYTYGYRRFSVVGGLLTTGLLTVGSLLVIYHAVARLFDPAPIHYDGMILFAVVGVVVNLCAAFFTREGGSMNQRAVSLHMLEDVLGWLVVLAGAVVMRFTELSFIDPLLSIGVSVIILIHAVGNLLQILELFLLKAPKGLETELLEKLILQVEGVAAVHHMHIWSLDGQNHCASMHIVTGSDPHRIKDAVRHTLQERGICHITVETESPGEHCHELDCSLGKLSEAHGHHHHHHHH